MSCFQSNKNTQGNNEDCRSKCVSKCGPIGWYFSPVLDKLGYSLLTVLYHLVVFPYTLAVMIIAATFFSVSAGLIIIVFGVFLYWFTCELSVLLARFDLAMAYFFVEDNPNISLNHSNVLQLSLFKKLGPCCCFTSRSCCDSMWIRMKSIMLNCDTYKIFLHQIIFKPLIVFPTCGMFIICVYNIASVFAPIVYLCYPPVFKNGHWCPLVGTDCDDGECKCYPELRVNNFGGALLFGIVAFLFLPFTLRLSIWFAKASKAVSYFFLTDYYNNNKNEEIAVGNLGNNDNNTHVRDVSVSIDGHKPTQTTNNNVYFSPRV